MLKRAKCTVYSVQDTDTLGKDSELASTLAQGKTVIAFVPFINVDELATKLAERPLEEIFERWVVSCGSRSPMDAAVKKLQEYCSSKVWPSLSDRERAESVRIELGDSLQSLCRAVAAAQKDIYDLRADNLMNTHPLAIQVHLDTGVANGVLVVRSVNDCANLLRSVLLCNMEFDIKEEDDGMWYLRERISGCIYRVVTNDQKLSNCFWNFYPR